MVESDAQKSERIQTQRCARATQAERSWPQASVVSAKKRRRKSNRESVSFTEIMVKPLPTSQAPIAIVTSGNQELLRKHCVRLQHVGLFSRLIAV